MFAPLVVLFCLNGHFPSPEEQAFIRALGVKPGAWIDAAAIAKKNNKRWVDPLAVNQVREELGFSPVDGSLIPKNPEGPRRETTGRVLQWDLMKSKEWMPR